MSSRYRVVLSLSLSLSLGWSKARTLCYESFWCTLHFSLHFGTWLRFLDWLVVGGRRWWIANRGTGSPFSLPISVDHILTPRVQFFRVYPGIVRRVFRSFAHCSLNFPGYTGDAIMRLHWNLKPWNLCCVATFHDEHSTNTKMAISHAACRRGAQTVWGTKILWKWMLCAN